LQCKIDQEENRKPQPASEIYAHEDEPAPVEQPKKKKGMLSKWMPSMPSIWPKAEPPKDLYVLQARYVTLVEGHFVMMRYLTEDVERDHGMVSMLGTGVPQIFTDSIVCLSIPITSLSAVCISKEGTELQRGRYYCDVGMAFADIAIGNDYSAEEKKSKQYTNSREVAMMIEVGDIDAFTIEIKRALEKAHHTRTMLRYQ